MGMWTDPAAGLPDLYHEESAVADAARLEREARERLALASLGCGVLLFAATVFGLAGYGLYKLVWG